MTVHHTGHGLLGCAGAGGAGLAGLQEHINEHHDRVVAHVQEHVGQVHERVNEIQHNVQEHVDNVRDAIQNHVGGGGAGESLGTFSQSPHLVFPDAPATLPDVNEHAFSLMAIPLPGGATMSIVAIVAIACLAIILASAVVKTVVVKCSN